MNLSKRQLKHIKKEYPGKTVEEISRELNIKPGRIYKALGLQTEFWTFCFENLTGYLVCLLVLIAPFVFDRQLSDFADLPQRAFIQAVTVFLLLLCAMRLTVKTDIRLSKNPLYMFGAASVLWSCASMLWAYNMHEAFLSAAHWAACVAVFAVVSTSLYNEKWLELIPVSALAAVTGVVFLGLGQQFCSIDWVPMLQPPSATFANANMAAQYVAAVLPIALAAGFCRKNNFLRCGVSAVAVLSLIFLFYTQCRAAWIAIVCALVWSVLMLARKRYGRVLSSKTSACIIIALAAVAVVWTGSVSVGSIKKVAGGSALYRLIVWRNCIEMVKEKPVLGFGAGNFKVFYPRYIHRAAIDSAFDKKNQIRRVHNDYIQTAVELGFAGLLMFIALPLYGLYMAWQLVYYRKDFKFNVVTIGASAGIISFMVTAVFSFPLQRSNPPLIFFICLGVLTVLYNRHVLNEKILRLKMPRAMGLTAMLLLLAAGGGLIRYNWNNISCDRFFRTALRMEKKGANSQALTAGITANKYNPDRMDVLSIVGRAYVTTGKPEKGIEVLNRVISRYPYNLNALFILGVAYINAGDREKALETLKRTLKIQPRFKDAKSLISIIKTGGKVNVDLS